MAKRKQFRPLMKVLPFGGYPFEVLLCVGVSGDAIVKRLKRLGCEVGEADMEYFRPEVMTKGRTVMLGGGQIIVMMHGLESSSDLSILIHELFHATCFLMRRIGVAMTESSEEAFAYCLQDVTARAFAAVDAHHRG